MNFPQFLAAKEAERKAEHEKEKKRCFDCKQVDVIFHHMNSKSCVECLQGTTKRCRKCGALRPKKEFPRSRGRIGGLFPYCSACERKRAGAKDAIPRGRSPKVDAIPQGSAEPKKGK
jgi:hypothetical protein